MTDSAMILHENGNSALSAYQDRDDVRELGDRLMAMHPAAAEVGAATMRAAAQLALLLGANPLPGVNEVHIWKDKQGRPCMSLGINYWRRKGNEWGGYVYEVRPRPMTSQELDEYGIPKGTIAAICKAARTADMLKFKQLGFTTREVWDMCGRTGIGQQGPNEYAKSGRPNVWTSLKRAETDVLRQLFPAEFSQVDQQVTAADAPIIAIDAGIERVEETEEVEKRPYTFADFNNDFGLDSGNAPAAVEDGLWDNEDNDAVDEPTPTEEPTPTASDFAEYAVTLPGPQATGFALDRLTAWVEFVTGGYDDAHHVILQEVLDSYCSAVADNGNKHTKKAVEKAQKDYRERIAAAEAEPEQSTLLQAEPEPAGAGAFTE